MNRWKRKQGKKLNVVRHACHTRSHVDFSTFYYRYDLPEQRALAYFNFLRFYPDSDGDSKSSTARSPNGFEPVESLYSEHLYKPCCEIISPLPRTESGAKSDKTIKETIKDSSDAIKTKGTKYWNKIRETKIRKSRKIRQAESTNEDLRILATERRGHGNVEDNFIVTKRRDCLTNNSDSERNLLVRGSESEGGSNSCVETDRFNKDSSYLATDCSDSDSHGLAAENSDNSVLQANNTTANSHENFKPIQQSKVFSVNHAPLHPALPNKQPKLPKERDQNEDKHSPKTTHDPASGVRSREQRTNEFKLTRTKSVEVVLDPSESRRRNLTRSKTISSEEEGFYRTDKGDGYEGYEYNNYDASSNLQTPYHYATNSREPVREHRSRTLERPILEPIPENHSLLVRSKSLKFAKAEKRSLSRTKSVDSGQAYFSKNESDFSPLENLGVKIPAKFITQTLETKPEEVSNTVHDSTDGLRAEHIPTRDNSKRFSSEASSTNRISPERVTSESERSFLPITNTTLRSESSCSNYSHSSSNYSLSASSSSESSSGSSTTSTSPETILENPGKTTRSQSLTLPNTGESTLWARATERKVGRDPLQRSQTLMETKTLPRSLKARSQSLTSSVSLRDLRMMQSVSDDELFEALERSIDIHSLQTSASRDCKEIPINESWLCRRYEAMGSGETRL